jgi:hypothetical protein
LKYSRFLQVVLPILALVKLLKSQSLANPEEEQIGGATAFAGVTAIENSELINIDTG